MNPRLQRRDWLHLQRFAPCEAEGGLQRAVSGASSALRKSLLRLRATSTGRRHARRGESSQAVLGGQEGRLRRLSVAFLAPSKSALPRNGAFSTGC